MSKKELEKLILKYKPKYLYQRYNGKIRKHKIINDRFLVDVKTGMSIDYKAHLILGTISANIIDLIELYDYVNNFLVFDIITYENGDKKIQLSTGVLIGNNEIENVITHEEFEERKFYV